MRIVSQWLIKTGFHLLYYQMAWTYDAVAWCVSFGQWAAWRRLALHFMESGPILELAYGTGGLFADMQELGHLPIGIDLSPYMARLASQRLRRKNLHITLNQAQAQSLPFPADSFSTVIATFPTPYIFEPETLTEVYRVLKPASDSAPAGRLVIVMEGQLRGPWPIRPFIDWLYKITDQRNFPANKPLPVFAQQYFNVRWETVEHNGAQARLLVADVDK